MYCIVFLSECAVKTGNRYTERSTRRLFPIKWCKTVIFKERKKVDEKYLWPLVHIELSNMTRSIRQSSNT